MNDGLLINNVYILERDWIGPWNMLYANLNFRKQS